MSMSRKIWFCFFLQILLYYCQTSFASPLIGKSSPAEEGEFPFIVSLSKTSNIIGIQNHFCGGTLISKRHVLTADHCMENEDISNVIVIVGTLNFHYGQIYQIASYEPYDIWKHFTGNRNDLDEEQHDIGIITLSQDVKNPQPATISNKCAEQVFGKKVLTAGWGLVNEVNRTRPSTLLKANLKVLTLEEYKIYTEKRYGESKIPQPQFYYTMADPPVVLGASDSGGPLVLKDTNELIGINHGCGVASPFCQNVEFPPLRYSSSTHVKINYAKHRQFIEETIRGWL